jgi:murein DD-endopeptidase MepM/ murein hydrolase activator NlpD
MARAAVALLFLCALAAAPAHAVDLVGTWYVLIHYKDSHAENADTERWDDRVWVFEKQGTRLRWTEYPIVVFEDESGRFERRQTGQYARILHFWEPSDVQLADIKDGLKVNSRGSKTKTLRGSDAKGWTSGKRTAAASASVLTYTEIWQIAGLPSEPVFSRSDVMGGGSSDSLEGLTRYTTKEVRDGGAELTGSFERDESRKGTFRMLRSAAVGSLEEKTQEQIQRQAAVRALEQSGEAQSLAGRAVDEQLAAVEIRVTSAEREQLTKSALERFARGTGPEEIGAQLAGELRGKLRQLGEPGARHDDAVRYRWPFDAPKPARLAGASSGTWRFELPPGTPVMAARDGVVVRVVDGYSGSDGSSVCGNVVYLRHADGTFAAYACLKPGIGAKPGASVKAGGALGSAGADFGASQASLVFEVRRLDAEARSQPVAIRFAGPTPEGVAPVEGQSYGGR